MLRGNEEFARPMDAFMVTPFQHLKILTMQMSLKTEFFVAQRPRAGETPKQFQRPPCFQALAAGPGTRDSSGSTTCFNSIGSSFTWGERVEGCETMHAAAAAATATATGAAVCQETIRV